MMSFRKRRVDPGWEKVIKEKDNGDNLLRRVSKEDNNAFQAKN